MRRYLLAAGLLGLAASPTAKAPAGLRFSVTFSAARSSAPLDGRRLILISTDTTAEPRFQVSDNVTSAQVYGMGVDRLRSSAPVVGGAAGVFGHPIRDVADLPRGRYRVQALLNRYETFHRSDGHTVKLPPDRGEGQQWSRKPGNLYSVPKMVELDPARGGTIALVLDQEIPPIEPPKETRYIKHERIRSKLMTEFWGRPTQLG